MSGKRQKLKAPFPWFGGKSRVSHVVWERFGNVPNYVEPFAGSLAVLLGRPAEWPAKNETVNDLDCYIANFWRALQADPDTVAAAADWPVNEADLHARHRWLHAMERHGGLDAFQERMHTDADFHDAELAGVWVWGLSCWIGDGWCRTSPQRGMPNLKRDKASAAFRGDGTGLDARRSEVKDMGVHREAKRPLILKGGAGVHRGSERPYEGDKGSEFEKRPQLGKGGRGVHAKPGGTGFDETRPSLHSGEGIHRPSLGKIPFIAKGARGVQSRQLPDISGDGGASGRGVHAKYTSRLYEYMAELAARLRYVRVCCGQWDRILGPSPTVHIGVTAVFLDPPYGDPDRDRVYSQDSREIAPAVRAWCLEHQDEKKLRIALCGYESEHDSLEGAGWDVVAWKAGGGYARGKRKANAARERIWFSPHCLRPSAERMPLLAALETV